MKIVFLFLIGAAWAAPVAALSDEKAASADAPKAVKQPRKLKLGLVPRRRVTNDPAGTHGAADLLPVTKPIDQGPDDATREGQMRQNAELQRLQSTLPNGITSNKAQVPQITPPQTAP